MTDGKNAQGLTGFPTPNTPTGGEDYLLFYVPDNPAYSQLVLGALKALTAAYNWYRSGDLNEGEAAEALRLIIEQAPYNKLPSCSLPTGEPVQRIDPETGNIQIVDDEGNWIDDPSLPPTPERPAGTPEEQRCLAAANAAKALEVLYETISDSFAGGLSVAEAITAFVAAVGTAIALEFYPPAAALIAIGGVIFEIIYQVVEFITADLWTEDFTNALQCYLYACASVDDNVVTFNFQCLINRLAEQTNAFDLTAEQLRLFGQLNYLLNFIGAQGLNYAGSGTGTTSADCSECPIFWCYQWDLTLTDGGWTPVVFGSADAAWTSGQGWGTGSNSPQEALLQQSFSSIAIDGFRVDFDGSILTGTNPYVLWKLNGTTLENEPVLAPIDYYEVLYDGQVITDLWIGFNSAWTYPAGTDTWTGKIVAFTMWGRGVPNPFGDDNCEYPD